MNPWKRRTLYYLVGLVFLMFVYAAIYKYSLAAFDGESISYMGALQFVVETFTATGYGSESPWTTDPMNLIVIVMDLTGVALIFIALPVLVFPLFEEVISTTVPTSVDEDLRDHVVICTLTSRGETLIAELDAWNVPYLIVESDRERASELYEAGYHVIRGDPQSVDSLEAANLSEARALVADSTDRINPSIVLTAIEVSEDVRLISIVDDPGNETYHRLAGADDVLNPRSLVGESLASKVTVGVSDEFDDTVGLGEDLELVELPLHRSSELVGESIAQSRLLSSGDLNIVGVWSNGEFESPPAPDRELESGEILLVTGRHEEIDSLRKRTGARVRHHYPGVTIVAGYGQVGSSIAQAFEDADVPYTVVDLEDKPNVDIVGDITDPEVLSRANIEDARSIIFALPDDALTEFATLVARDGNDVVEILARAEDAENVQKVYRAGADYVLSLATISGRMLASTVLDREEVVTTDGQIEVIRTDAPGLAGRSLGDADVRARTGCTVLAVARDGERIVDLDADVDLYRRDELIVAGTDEAINRFTEQFC